MKITPTSDILISGHHSPAGVAVDAPESIARALIAQGLAAPVAEKVPEVETATAAPAAETAARTPTRRTRTA